MTSLPKIRRKKNKTNYLKRKNLLQSRKPRIVVRRSNKYITLQYVESKVAQDSIKASAMSSELVNYGWPKEKSGSLKSLAAAYLTGILFGKRISKLGSAVLDTGLIRSTKGSKVYAAVKGIADSGFKLHYDEKIAPEQNRINSENTKAFFDKVKAKVMEEKI